MLRAGVPTLFTVLAVAACAAPVKQTDPGMTATTVAITIIPVITPTNTGASPALWPRPFSKPSASEIT